MRVQKRWSVNRRSRNAFRYRRCLIPADGFYEWQLYRFKGQAALVHCATRPSTHGVCRIMGTMAESCRRRVESCSIIVTDANELMKPIHDRMPVILAPDDWDAWLETDAKNAQAYKFAKNLILRRTWRLAG